jgi:hypothetical protein
MNAALIHAYRETDLHEDSQPTDPVLILLPAAVFGVMQNAELPKDLTERIILDLLAGGLSLSTNSLTYCLNAFVSLGSVRLVEHLRDIYSAEPNHATLRRALHHGGKRMFCWLVNKWKHPYFRQEALSLNMLFGTSRYKHFHTAAVLVELARAMLEMGCRINSREILGKLIQASLSCHD